MVQEIRQGSPHELQIGRLRISGLAPTKVLIQLSELLTVANAPDYLLISKHVHALLDHSALAIGPLDTKESYSLVLNLESPELVSWAGKPQGNVSWYCAGDPTPLLTANIGHYRGTYSPDPKHLVYSNEKGTEAFLLSPNRQPTPELLVAVCIAREGGFSSQIVRKLLKS